jgi:hypothetical protein
MTIEEARSLPIGALLRYNEDSHMLVVGKEPGWIIATHDAFTLRHWSVVEGANGGLRLFLGDGSAYWAKIERIA